MTAFTSHSTFDSSHPHALALYCSDGRFTNPVEDLLRQLGHERLDTLTLPGGPGLLNMLTAKFGDLDATKRAAGFLIESHAIRDVILIAHDGCGYYRRRMAGKSPADIEAAQIRDLHVAAKLLEKAHPTVASQVFYARIVEDRVRFELHAAPDGASKKSAR